MNSRKKLTEDQELEVVELYLSKHSAESIGKKFGISTTPIFSILKRKEIPVRNRSKARQTYALNEDYFEQIDSPEKAYILGVLYTDGNNFRKANRVALGMNDLDVVTFFKNQLECNKPIYIVSKDGENLHYRMDITNKKISEDLEALGCISNKSHQLLFPDSKILPEEYIPNFLQGAFDGDGCICKNKKRPDKKYFIWNFIGTESMCGGFKNFIKSQLNEEVSIKKNVRSQHLFYITIYDLKKITKIMTFLYEKNSFKMKRKFEIFNTIFN